MEILQANPTQPHAHAHTRADYHPEPIEQSTT